MKPHIFLMLITLLYSIFASCNRDQGVPCTEEYRYITITVNGDMLDDHFTIRDINGDTIRHENDPFTGEKTYIVLSDSYQTSIMDKVENFTFKGYINDTLVVNEPFVIKADKCHIEYVSGNTMIDL